MSVPPRFRAKCDNPWDSKIWCCAKWHYRLMACKQCADRAESKYGSTFTVYAKTDTEENSYRMLTDDERKLLRRDDA